MTKAKLLIFTTTLFIYISSYVAIQDIKPTQINSNDGPNLFYQYTYYPLRYITSEKPEYYWTSLAGLKSLQVSEVSLNSGNGYLYFTLNGLETRAEYLGKEQSIELSISKISFGFHLVSNDAFANFLVPQVKRVPQ